MTLTKRNIQQLYLGIAALCWILLLATDGVSFFTTQQPVFTYLNFAVRYLMVGGFTLSVLLFYKLTIGSFDGQGFNDLLWKSFITGLITTVLLASNEFLSTYVMTLFPQKDQLVKNAFYQITIASSVVFVAAIFFTFKKMILYQKSKETANLWNVFEYMVYLSIAFNLLNVPYYDILFSLAAIPVLVMGVILSLNLKWIAYLNFSQKWISILFLVTLFIFDCIYIFNIFKQSNENDLITDLANNLFIISILLFLGIYAIFSVLVLLFNLPTSSVFEQKFGEVVNLQKLSNSSQLGKSEEEVYELLIESCVGTFVANAAALEILDADANPKNIVYRNMDRDRFYALKTYLRKNGIRIDTEYVLIEDTKRLKNNPVGTVTAIHSLLAIPLQNHGEKLGVIYLASELKNGFDKELISIVGAYVNQASVSIANFRLISQAVQNARYKEDLEIAKRVQEKLLPKKNINDDHIEMATFTESPDEIGGDYYDFYKHASHLYNIAIGDVSGKGTSASFHMANLKGIFHSLVQFGLDPITFMDKANTALSVSLAKSSFATFSLIQLDFNTYTYQMARAGHCPILHFKQIDEKAVYIEPKGLGLGIIRNETFKQMLEPVSGSFASGDLFIGFTDGIVEANNENDEEFGYQRIKELVEENAHLNPEQLISIFASLLHKYCGPVRINDDHTIIAVRIK